MEKRDTYHYFCRNIRFLRQTHGMTQKEMAAVLGIGAGKLRRLERGEPGCRVNGEMLCRLCDHFDLSADAVLRTLLEPECGG